MRRYNPKEIEPKWQRIWDDTKLYEVDTKDATNKFYVIPMFPYPSGDLHIGHWYNFAPTDTVARWQRMQGHRVLHTNGFDAFGLPAENAAIKRNIPPAEWTKQNIASMTQQMKAIGASYDWSKQVFTNDPNYYRWTQWIFLKLFEKKLAYRAKALVNWCPKDQTVLADEQVVGEDNVCERCGTPVIKKEMEQWFFKITDYAHRLLKDLDTMDWPPRVKHMQINWIGESQGMLFEAPVKNMDMKLQTYSAHFEAFRADTFVVIAPDHPLLPKLVKGTEAEAKVLDFAQKILRKRVKQGFTDEEHVEGIFTGRYIEDPVGNGDLPIWVASYALSHYGTGIVKCSAHDERDFKFAKKYGIPLKPVLLPPDEKETEKVRNLEVCYTDMQNGILTEPEEFKGAVSGQVRERIIDYLVKHKLAKPQTAYRIRDWLISRQRYWGPPIPIIYCEKCGIQPVPEADLPVLLPENVHFQPTGQSPLLQDEKFVNTRCPNCQGPAKRETDTMDTFVDSSWYFLRYPNPTYEKGPFDPEIISQWGPVDHYIGGIEHAILHLLYARFITMFLHDHHDLPFEEPFKKLSNQGIILGPDGHKMSKSRGNVVSPDQQVNDYGADSLRLYLMFMGPYDQGGPYSMGGIAGTRRFLDRLWTLTGEFLDSKPTSDTGHNAEVAVGLNRAVHKATQRVTQDIEKLDFNTAIAALMECVNELYKIKAEHGFRVAYEAWGAGLSQLVQLLAPFSPHITEELWAALGNSGSVHVSRWPSWDEQLVKEELITLAVQINGRVRAEILLGPDVDKEGAVKAAKADERIAKLLEGKAVKKAIYVPGRLVSLVTD